MTPDGSERRKCQSKTSSEYQKDKNHDNRRNKKNFNTENKDTKIVKDCPFFGSVINSNGDCSQGINRRVRLGRAAIELGKLTKSKDISLDTKVKITHTLVFPIMMYKVASWTVKKADRKKNDSFERWCWKRALQIP